MSLINILTKLVPCLGSIVGKVFGSSSNKAQEIHAQVELTEAEAFKSGHVAPRYVFQYILAFIFFLGAIVLLLDLSWPGLLPGGPAVQMSEFIDSCVVTFTSIFGD